MGIELTISLIHVHKEEDKEHDEKREDFFGEFIVSSTHGGACPHEEEMVQRIRNAAAGIANGMKLVAFSPDLYVKIKPLIEKFLEENNIQTFEPGEEGVVERLGIVTVESNRKYVVEDVPSEETAADILKNFDSKSRH